ncbi:MAG: VCBS repeat-containing protein [Phycisphaeraceae bacterium]|nr:MAG: VCBS repeat-containing protein [Phycisphaeraceae bacterium]
MHTRCLPALIFAAASAQAQPMLVPNVAQASDPCRVLAPGAPSPFTQEAFARGVFYYIGNPSNGYATAAMGAASFADLDLDGDADIVCVGEWFGRVGVYENDGTGHFIDHSAGAPIVPSGGGVIAGDYDGDNDLDLFITVNPGTHVLLRNDGGFTFTDVSDEAGITGPISNGGGASFGDVNGDGWLDIYAATRTGPTSLGGYSDDPNHLYINQGDGTFVDMYTQLGLTTGLEPTLVGHFVDFDLDGDADIYEGNDKGSFCIERSNYLYENVGGTFVDITAQSGTESCTDTMSIGIGDFDMNGWPDLYCTHTAAAPGNTLLLNNGDATFTQSAAAFGVDSLALAWGAGFFDHDNDGDLALYVCDVVQPDRLFDYQGAWPAVNIAAQMNAHSTGHAYNVSFADIDLDGDLDFLVELIPGNVQLYINHEGEKRHWIDLNVLGTPPNTHAIGALLTVRTGQHQQIAQVLAGGNTYRSQNELPRHFGLGDACRADEIQITWPDGSSRTLTDYPADARYTILPPQQLGDGELDLADLRSLAASFGPVRPGTEAFDMDGNGRIDRVDLARLVDCIGGSPLPR